MLQKLNGHVPPNVLAELPLIIDRYHCNTALRLAHFLSQTHHESAGFTRAVENLNYTNIERIVAIFRHDVDRDHNGTISDAELQQAKKYVGKPEALANFVYANQNGNGNEQSGDGWKHRGMGYIQTTGKKNQQQFFASIGLPIDSNPMLITMTYPLTSAGWFFDSNRLWKWCDVGAGNQAVFDVTKRVNGGTNGLAERLKLFNHYYALLTH